MALTKPRIIELLLVTTVPTMIVAEQGLPSLWLIVCTVLGGTLAAGGANAINMYVDRDIDAADGAHQGPAARHRRRHAPGRPHLRHRARGRGLRLPLGHRQPAQRRAGRRRLPLLRVRVHAVAEAHLDPQHRDRRRRRGRADAHRLELGHRHPRLGARCCSSPSSSTGPRRTSGPSPSATGTTTPPPTCRCCPSVASLRRTSEPDPRLHAAPVGAHGRVLARWPAWATSTWGRRSSSAPSSPGTPSACSACPIRGSTLSASGGGRPSSRSGPPRCACSPGRSPTSRLLFGAMAVDQLLRSGW